MEDANFSVEMHFESNSTVACLSLRKVLSWPGTVEREDISMDNTMSRKPKIWDLSSPKLLC